MIHFSTKKNRGIFASQAEMADSWLILGGSDRRVRITKMQADEVCITVGTAMYTVIQANDGRGKNTALVGLVDSDGNVLHQWEAVDADRAMRGFPYDERRFDSVVEMIFDCIID